MRGELDDGVSAGGVGGVDGFSGVGEGSEVLGAVVGGEEPVAVGCPPEEHAGVGCGDGPESVGFGVVFAAGEGSEIRWAGLAGGAVPAVGVGVVEVQVGV